MRVVYLGTPEFSVKPLERVLSIKGIEVCGVITNKDKPVGRKQVLTPPPVKVKALENGLPVFQYEKIKMEGVEDLKALNPDLMITCAFGQILSQEILDIPKLGVINIHASLLPKYRGATPINQAILDGEKQTGITIMKTDIGIDTGDIIYQKSIEIGEEETAGELSERLSILGAECIEKVLGDIIEGEIIYTKQDDNLSTYTKMLRKEDARIDFNKSAREIVNQIRAYNPAPIAFANLDGQPFKVYRAKAVDVKGEVGVIIESEKNLIIGCAEGGLQLIKVQKSGGKAMEIGEFLRGNKLQVGKEFK